MLTNSRDIKRRLEREGWVLVRTAGSHHVFKEPASRETIVLPHPKKDGSRPRPCHLQASWLGAGLSRKAMTHYVAIVEDAGPDKAVGVWFPDLPGCFSAGDNVDEALRNAEQALGLYADVAANEGRTLPPPRTVSELREVDSVASDLKDHVVALIALHSDAVHAAE
jgi:predicted RNase H-like HicB family nuclease/predicted RNA binding protein YcfA (HicA-like mRNA interferase family)